MTTLSESVAEVAQERSTAGRRRYFVVGSGVRYVSGITYYTYHLASELGRRGPVSTILMRRLVPGFLYPGGKRGKVTDLEFSRLGPTFDGVDWTGWPSVWLARRFVRRHRPDVAIFQVWTGTVFPWYFLLLRSIRAAGAIVILELHEDLDTAEAKLPVVGTVLRRLLGRLVKLTDGYVVHSSWDRDRLVAKLNISPDRVAVIPHGPFPMAQKREAQPKATEEQEVTILFFGTIRPYKGLEHLIAAFDRLPRQGADRKWKLLVVGETWENWHEPAKAMQRSPHQGDIELVNRYVTDAEVPEYFARADLVALPYLRSSASGPLQLALSAGLPVVVTEVGGLVEVVAEYTGAVLVPPGDVAALTEGIQRALSLVGQSHAYDWNWQAVGDAYERLVDTLGANRTSSSEP
jgi:glycosyltransferase involved in cell wall biosynthesis